MTKITKIVITVPETKKKTASKVEAWVTKAEMTDHLMIQEMVVVDLTNTTIEMKDRIQTTVVDHMTTSQGTAETTQETDFKDSLTVTTIKEDSLIMISETMNITVVHLALTLTEMMMVVVVATSESKEEVEAVNSTEAHLDNNAIVKIVMTALNNRGLVSARDLDKAITHEVKQLLSSQRTFKLSQTSST